MSLLARRNLFHDKVRFAVTLTGIVFSILLMAVQFGLFVGFLDTTSNNIAHSDADLWVVSKGVKYFDIGGWAPFSERKLNLILGTPGVEAATKYIVQYIIWKRADGGTENIQIIGFNPESMIGGPWNVIAGRPQDLKTDNTVFIDDIYREKLGFTHLGQVAEINGHRARIVGMTEGIRSFTTSPFVFASFKSAQNYIALREDQTVYILVRARAGADLQQVKRDVAARVSGVDVHTRAEFSRMTQRYWIFTTGAGIATLIAAMLGLIVGVVVVAQTIYATTIDHLREFGTLKAMGASNRHVYRVIIEQAIISALIGYALGISLSLVIVHLSRRSEAAILLPWEMAVGLFVLTNVMCISASIVSINKVTHIDPAMVFKS
jgi:putative ABC transport system permease protein